MNRKLQNLLRRIKTEYAFRTLFFASISFSVSIAFGLFNGAQGILYSSIWNGALAAYYVSLAFLRGGVLYQQKKWKARNATEDTEDGKTELLLQAKTYRNSGVVLLFLQISLSVATAQMIFDNQHFTYAGWTIYGAAAYAFTRITVSIIQIKKVRKHENFTLRAIRTANLADAAVSILALQTALLSTFGSEDVNASLFNTITGIAVSLLTVTLGIFAIVDAHKNIRNIQGFNQNNG